MVSAATDTAEALSQTQEGAPGATDTASPPPETPAQAPVSPDLPDEWKERFTGIQARATRAEQELAELKRQQNDDKAWREAAEKSLQGIMAPEEWEAYQSDFKQRTEANVAAAHFQRQEQSLLAQLESVVRETAAEIIDLGTLADSTDLKAALKANQLGEAMLILAEHAKVPIPFDVDAMTKLSGSERLATLEQAVSAYGSQSRKTLSKLQVTHSAAKLEARITALEEALKSKDEEIVTLKEQGRGVPQPGGGGSTRRFTREEVAAMSPAEFKEHKEEILAASTR